jgi:hypothetical protein
MRKYDFLRLYVSPIQSDIPIPKNWTQWKALFRWVFLSMEWPGWRCTVARLRLLSSWKYLKFFWALERIWVIDTFRHVLGLKSLRDHRTLLN